MSAPPAAAMTISHGLPAPLALDAPSPVAGAMREGSALPDGAGAINAGPVGVDGTAVPRNGVVAGVAVTLGDTAADGVAITVVVTVAVVVSVAVAVPGVGDGVCAETLLMPAMNAVAAHASATAAAIKDIHRTSRIVSLLLLLNGMEPLISVGRTF